jgi:hypothetical protein
MAHLREGYATQKIRYLTKGSSYVIVAIVKEVTNYLLVKYNKEEFFNGLGD